MKAQLKSLDGLVVGDLELPVVFGEAYRPDLIKRTVLALQSTRYQPHGAHPYAGIRTSAHSWGSGRGVAHVPRLKNGSRAARVPQAKGGREAHPPKMQKVLQEKVNKKEKKKALCSAIAATANETLVRARGHRFDCTLPVVVEDRLEGLHKTEEVAAALQTLGILSDVERSKDSRKVRPGRGKLRGRRFKQRKSILIVTATEPLQAAMNLPGVDAVSVDSLNTEHLAPGTQAGRLTIWTEGALRHLGGMPE